MARYQIRNVTFTFPEQEEPALHGISLDITEGEFVLLCGSTGSGKTTFIRHLKREIWPEGKRTGSFLYDGCPLEELPPQRAASEIGMVFQDPEAQIVMGTVEQELAFGLENLGFPPAVIQRRMAEMVSFLGMEGWLRQSVHELSGGQKQLLNLASVLLLRPKVLLLDEPTAQLDPIAAKEFLQVLHRLNEEMSITVVIAEHRLEELFPYASRVCLFHRGTVKYAGPARQVIADVWASGDKAARTFLPAVSRMALAWPDRQAEAIPLTVKEGKMWMARVEGERGAGRDAGESSQPSPVDDAPSSGKLRIRGRSSADAIMLKCRSVFFQYEKDSPFLLHGCSFEVRKGELMALMGGNGAGKSTLLRVLSSLLKPQRGAVELDGKPLSKWKEKERIARIGYLAQNPLLYFNRDTVRELLDERLSRLDLSEAEQKRRLEEMVTLFELEPILNHHPYDISGGQQQKTALALVLLADPELLLLDEPTKGLDPYQKEKLAELLGKWLQGSRSILMVSHDVEFAARYATRSAMLFNGSVIGPEETSSFFQQNYFYTTVVQRVAAERWPSLVTEEDVINRWQAFAKGST
ncbi:ABC transporter ATP-binding protein [Paenibacillus sp. GCM10012307]|uniref:ATP-binding cassette domain-containing protein n=1 Tax=Paenibacillus roseus TaxID=2798579 RepID=A0A934MR04_9BACL|nr:ATP-binding cassette domain-containing protein [Paenibacillus roseus]MBJ6361869.1 ATP-binding cassette domain-containing protein [Paenibacillus roseus]